MPRSRRGRLTDALLIPIRSGATSCRVPRGPVSESQFVESTLVHISTSTVLIEARPATVWAVITEAAYVKQWQYGSVLRTDWKVGSLIHFTSEWEGRIFEQWGTVLRFNPPLELRYSLFAPRPDVEDRPENYFTMIYTLEAVGGETLLTITQEDPREEASTEEVGGEENPILTALKQLAESVESITQSR